MYSRVATFHNVTATGDGSTYMVVRLNYVLYRKPQLQVGAEVGHLVARGLGVVGGFDDFFGVVKV